MICAKCHTEYLEGRSIKLCNTCLSARNKIHTRYINKRRKSVAATQRSAESKIKRAHEVDCIFCGMYADVTI